MPKFYSNCRICVICPRTSSARKWTKDQIEKWVKQAGGALHKEFDVQNTTHLVVEEQPWRNKTMAVQLALEANANGRKVCIVTPQWLDDCLVAARRGGLATATSEFLQGLRRPACGQAQNLALSASWYSRPAPGM